MRLSMRLARAFTRFNFSTRFTNSRNLPQLFLRNKSLSILAQKEEEDSSFRLTAAPLTSAPLISISVPSESPNKEEVNIRIFS